MFQLERMANEGDLAMFEEQFGLVGSSVWLRW
jgi:hypothetical protein